MATCPYCHQDPGDGSRCENCGEILYRYARDVPDEPEETTPPTDTRPSHTSPSRRSPDDPFDGDPFSESTRPPAGPVGTGPRLNVPASPPPVSRQYQSPGGPGSDTTPPGQYPPKQAYQAKQASTGPNGCAIAAIILGALLVLGIIGLFVAGRSVFDEVIDELENEGFSFTTGDQINWDEVVIGDCVNFVDASDIDGATVFVSTLERVPCTERHDAEVYALRDLPGSAWPGYESVYSSGDDICYEAFAPYVGIDYIDSLYFYEVYTPSPESWDDGDRTVACTLIDLDGPLDKPLRGSRE